MTDEEFQAWLEDSLQASRRAQSYWDSWRVEQERLYRGMNLVTPGPVTFTDERETMQESTGRYVMERAVAVVGVALGMWLYRVVTGH